MCVCSVRIRLVCVSCYTPTFGDHDVHLLDSFTAQLVLAIEPEAGRVDIGNVAAINLKLPPLLPSDQEVWFAQVEAQFSTRGIIEQKTKLVYIVATLSPKFATEVRYLILRPPGTHPYDTTKQQLIRKTAALEQRRLQQLLTTEEHGDLSPLNCYRGCSNCLDTEKLPLTELPSASSFSIVSSQTFAWS